jgi:hypothetical protein
MRDQAGGLCRDAHSAADMRGCPRTAITSKKSRRLSTRLCHVFSLHSQPASSSVIVHTLNSNLDPLPITHPPALCLVLSGRSRKRDKHPLINSTQQLLLIPHYQSRRIPPQPFDHRQPSRFYPPESEIHCWRDHDAINTVHVVSKSSSLRAWDTADFGLVLVIL